MTQQEQNNPVGGASRRWPYSRGQSSWALFQWARDPYVILITIYIYAPYFSNFVVGDPVRGQEIWGYINGVSGAAIACLAPLLGAIADTGGRRKPWIAAFVSIMVPAVFLLWFSLPGGEGLSVLTIAFLIIVIAVAFEFSSVFHNAMLPSIVSAERLGGLSGLGLALGNLGALLILVFMLYAFALPANPAIDWGFLPDGPLFGIDAAAFEHYRISAPLAAVWMLLFTMPLFFYTQDAAAKPTSGQLKHAVMGGLKKLVYTIRSLRHYRNIALYLGARMLYNDGKTAILIFGGVYAAGVFGWDAISLLIYGIILSVFAVSGGIFGGWLDDNLGSQRAILVSIGGTSIGLVLAVSMTPTQILFFIPYDPATAPPLWSFPYFQTLPEVAYVIVVILIAIFITAAYANSRTMLARIAPPSKMTEFFGLYALSGTATAFIAPALVGFSTRLFDSQRAGFASILILLVAGLIMMLWVRQERTEEVA